MKFNVLLFFVLTHIILSGQSPQLINYQGLARNSAGVPLINRSIGIKFELRQGSGTGSTVFSEQQNSIVTNSLGLFTTQIGKINTNGLAQVNWQNGPFFLNIAVDTAGVGAFTDLGSQQLVSVPYALNAETVPSSYNNNVLNIGGATYTLGQQQTYAEGPGISITGSLITNTAPDQTVTLTPGNSNISIGGAYPDYTLSVTPQLNINGNELSISNGNTVTIIPGLGITGNTLTVGPAGNTITLPSPGTPSILGTGIANVTPLTGTDFTVNVAPPLFTSTGPSSITGTYPNLILNSPVIPSLTAAGIATVSSGPAYQVGVPAPVFNNVGPTTISGTYPNLTITSPTVPQAATVTGAGIATVSPGPAFTVGVQPPVFTNNGPGTISGTHPNFVLNTPASPSVSATGIATVSPGPNYLVGVPAPVYSNNGPVTVTGTYPNYAVNSPNTPTVSAAGIATVSPGPNYNVGVQSPTFTSIGITTISGIYPNLTVTTPIPPSPTITGQGLAIVTQSAGMNYTVNVPALVYNATTAVLSSGTNTVLVNPVLNFSNNVLSSGSPGNSVSLVASPWTETGAGVILTNTANNVGIGTNLPSENLQVESAGGAQVSVISGNTMASSLAFGTATNHFLGHIRYNNNNNSMSFWTNNTADRLFINSTGNVGIRNNNPSSDLSIFNPGPVSSLQLRHGTSPNGFIMSFGTGNVTMLNHDNSPVILGSNAINKWFFMPDGELRIGHLTSTAYTGLSVRGEGAFNNRILITGGDNSNSYGGIISFAENQNQVGGMSLKLDAGANRLFFTTDLAANSGIMSVGGYSGSNPGVAIGSSYAYSNPPVNGLIVEGNTGIGTASPSERLDVTGSVKIVDGTQGDGKSFISDINGRGAWRSSPTPTVFAGLNVSSTFIGTSPTAVGIGVRTFVKAYANSQIEIDVYTRASTGLAINPLIPFNFMKFQIYVDGVTTPYSTEHVIFGQNTTEYITLKAVFPSLSAGSHTITIRANTDSSSSTGATIDPSGYGGKIIVQERF